MRIVFMDVDGVLNSIEFTQRTNLNNWPKGHLDPLAVARLNRLLREGQAKVVTSSTWRKLLDPEEMTRVLREVGFDGEIIGETPDFSKMSIEERKGIFDAKGLRPGEPRERYPYQRGHEIEFWLKEHPEVSAYVILDDDSDMADVRDHLVKTSYETGLLDEHVEQALQILGPA